MKIAPSSDSSCIVKTTLNYTYKHEVKKRKPGVLFGETDTKNQTVDLQTKKSKTYTDTWNNSTLFALEDLDLEAIEIVCDIGLPRWWSQIWESGC